MPKIPQYGDKEMLSTDPTVRPSAERMPFGPSGERLPEGPVRPADFLSAPDIKGQPWHRARGDEWTTREFRDIVRAWIVEFMAAQSWISLWDVTEKASAPATSTLGLPPDQQYLLIKFTRRSDREVLEVAAPFRPEDRTEPAALFILAHVGLSFTMLASIP